jgi:hypothetical protein
MNTKITLSVDQNIVGEIKTYAKQHKVSLSKLVENYFYYIVHHTDNNNISSTLVEELSGIIDIPENFDEKQLYENYLNEKY